MYHNVTWCFLHLHMYILAIMGYLNITVFSQSRKSRPPSSTDLTRLRQTMRQIARMSQSQHLKRSDGFVRSGCPRPIDHDDQKNMRLNKSDAGDPFFLMFVQWDIIAQKGCMMLSRDVTEVELSGWSYAILTDVLCSWKMSWSTRAQVMATLW